MWEHQGLPIVRQDAVQFNHYERTRAVDSIVLHESAGLHPVSRMRKNGWGTHFVVDKHGDVSQYVDIALACSHAPGMNLRAIGIEIVNPYYGPAIIPWDESIKAPWAHRRHGHERRYAVPPLCQLEACWQLVSVLTSVSLDDIEIHRVWPGATDGSHEMAFQAGVWQRPGVVAHCHSVNPTRADGPFVSLYCWLRATRGLGPKTTRDLAMGLALQRVAVVV